MLVLIEITTQVSQCLENSYFVAILCPILLCIVEGLSETFNQYKINVDSIIGDM